jgi:hypothetical protein
MENIKIDKKKLVITVAVFAEPFWVYGRLGMS